MASTNKTTNYELSQFEGTDKPSWEADYNADMLAIDTNLKAVSDVADGASGSISTLADRVTTAEGNITTNANDIDALEARADALEAGETAADGRLDAIEAEQIVQNTAIESNTRLGYNLARPYDSASTYALNSYVLFQDTLYKCTTAVTTGEAFDPTKWLAIKATDEIAAGGYTLPTASANDLGGVKVGVGLAMTGDFIGEYNTINKVSRAITLTGFSGSYDTVYIHKGTLNILTINMYMGDSQGTTFIGVDYAFDFTNVIETQPILTNVSPITAIACTGANSINSGSTRVATAIPISAQMYINSNDEKHLSIQAQHIPFTNNNTRSAGDYFRVTFVW